MLHDIGADHLLLFAQSRSASGRLDHDPVDDLHDHEGHDEAVDQCDRDVHELSDEHVEVSLNHAAVSDPAVAGDREDTHGNAAPDTPNTVDTHDVEGIVDARLLAHEDDTEVDDRCGHGSDDRRRPGIHESASGGDSDQSGQDSGTETGDVDPSDVQILDDDPCNGAHGGREHGVDHSEHRDFIEGPFGSAVESEPSEPEDHGSEEHHRHVVGTSGGDSVAPSPDGDGTCDPGDCGAHVDDGSSREVLCGESDLRDSVREESSEPDHVRHGRINQERPKGQERQDGRIPYPLGRSTEYDAGGHYGEESLEQEELQRGDVPVALLDRQTAAEDVVQVPDELSVAACG